LKWAETTDGFIDFDRSKNEFGEPTWITGEKALVLVHQMRAVEDSILVGTNTALKDNPSLTVRHCEGTKSDKTGSRQPFAVTQNLNLFDKTVKTIVFNSLKNEVKEILNLLKSILAKR
jgi:diaminohydroxyphosphoribosylaminopyrimidine deaminase / 5-amino-6-(5-phosphoribosylamino)uracil reductase